ncbi:oligopeptide transport system substrate-binding protein/dipeptide transport system substrate-binding protein [Planifilum fimeticola]|uniref:Oligopeptide transport system substrate-binding protein/dipeptide transport system substrate-binding protein n=1 Tax=Planifilum fimeticola TaxID=201975 RepID=A0A2T0LIW5_9BACL|nr:peptide ABC transporter substrate-binding protein [Planifilum fimeticola]PRX42342.1 oligopeptide transport system substrate-binding protein/dipeptide transport system substrate-binding protein [Planifilum fimeticola]
MKKGKWTGRISAILIAFSLVFTAACGGGGSDQGKGSEELAEEQVLNVGRIKSEPPSLDPATATDQMSSTILNQLMEGLTRIDAEGNPHPAVAEKWEVSEDGKEITFHLRKDAKWSNGDPVTAHDFEYAWKRVLDPKMKPPADYAYQLYYLKNGEKYNQGKAKAEDVGVKAVDDHTLKVELEQPAPYFVALTSFYTLFPVNKKVAEENDKWATEADTYVGNGPFKLKTWEHDAKIELVKNEHYWGAKDVKLTQLNFPFIGEAQTGYQQFKSRKLDEGDSIIIPPDLTKKGLESGEIKSQKQPAVYFYMFNVEKKPFNNKKIRRAFALAIDRKSIVENVTQGGQVPATGFVPWGIPDFVAEKDWVETRDDYLPEKAQPEEAKKLLEEGMKEEGFDKLPAVTIDYNTDEGHKKIAEAIQQMWKKNLGVDVKLRNSEWQVYLDKTKAGDFQVGRLGWLPDYIDPMTFMDMWVTGGGNNDTRFSHKEYDALIKKAKSTADQKVRMEAMHKAEDILMDEMPIAPIYFYTDLYMEQDYVKGVVRNPDKSVYFRDAYILEH